MFIRSCFLWFTDWALFTCLPEYIAYKIMPPPPPLTPHRKIISCRPSTSLSSGTIIRFPGPGRVSIDQTKWFLPSENGSLDETVECENFFKVHTVWILTALKETNSITEGCQFEKKDLSYILWSIFKSRLQKFPLDIWRINDFRGMILSNSKTESGSFWKNKHFSRFFGQKLDRNFCVTRPSTKGQNQNKATMSWSHRLMCSYLGKLLEIMMVIWVSPASFILWSKTTSWVIIFRYHAEQKVKCRSLSREIKAILKLQPYHGFREQTDWLNIQKTNK